MADNGRYGGGAGGKEDRYSHPAVDDARFDEAHVGSFDTSPIHTGGTSMVPESKANTVDGPARGTCLGACYSCDTWRAGF